MWAASGVLRKPADQTQSEALARMESQLAEANKRIEQQASELQEVQQELQDRLVSKY